MAAGVGIGAGIGGYVTLATGLSEHSNGGALGDFCNVEKGVPSLKCTLLGAAIGGSAGTLLGFASSKSEPEPPSSIKLGVAVGMIGLVLGAGAGAVIGRTTEIKADEAVKSGREHECIDNDCTLRWATMLGAVGMGTGVVLGLVIGAKKDDARSNGVDVGLYPQRNNGLVLRALVRF
ncbi:MAG: hypothetical protein ACE10E_14730 [Acidiferrobacterales bacterium]